MELVHHIAHICRGHKLPLLYIYNSTAFGSSIKQISLTAQKRRNLNYICHLGHRLHLLLGVNIRNDRYLQFILDVLQHFKSLLQTRTSETVKGRTVGLVKGSLENVRNPQLATDFLDCATNQQTTVHLLQNTWASQQSQRFAITNFKITHLNSIHNATTLLPQASCPFKRCLYALLTASRSSFVSTPTKWKSVLITLIL